MGAEQLFSCRGLQTSLTTSQAPPRPQPMARPTRMGHCRDLRALPSGGCSPPRERRPPHAPPLALLAAGPPHQRHQRLRRRDNPFRIAAVQLTHGHINFFLSPQQPLGGRPARSHPESASTSVRATRRYLTASLGAASNLAPGPGLPVTAATSPSTRRLDLCQGNRPSACQPIHRSFKFQGKGQSFARLMDVSRVRSPNRAVRLAALPHLCP